MTQYERSALFTASLIVIAVVGGCVYITLHLAPLIDAVSRLPR